MMLHLGLGQRISVVRGSPASRQAVNPGLWGSVAVPSDVVKVLGGRLVDACRLLVGRIVSVVDIVGSSRLALHNLRVRRLYKAPATLDRVLEGRPGDSC